ncbi:MAG TPA: hypothetical protein VFQ00_10375 [Terriglobales bacterium]|nr:hypothetical protein [Terriglobales bacterium]
MSRRARPIRFFLIALSLLVFLFALSSKLSVYQSAQPLTAKSTSKLWLNGQKMEAQAPVTVAPLLWSLGLFLFALFAERSSRFAAFDLPTPTPISSFELERFLRPPPFLRL